MKRSRIFYYKCISIIWHSVHNWIIPFNQRTYYSDRVVAFDASSAVIMCIIGIVSVIYNTVSFLDSIMLVAIISFVSSVSISRFIGEVEYSMAQINEIIELIALLIFLGSIIAVISAIGIVKFQDVFYEAMHLLRVLRYLSY